MASFNYFDQTAIDLGKALHDFTADTIKCFLTNTAPNTADTHVDTTTTTLELHATSSAAEIAAGNGYTKGGNSCTFTSYSGDPAKLVLADPATWTATPSSMATFRYVVMYNDSKGTTSTRPPIGWWDYGQTVTLQLNETFTVDLSDTNGVLTVGHA